MNLAKSKLCPQCHEIMEMYVDECPICKSREQIYLSGLVEWKKLEIELEIIRMTKGLRD